MASAFRWDGSLRDIYVAGATIDDWQRVLDALRLAEPIPAFSIDGKASPLPNCAAKLFEARSATSPLLTLGVGGVCLNCHFFNDEEIEFDLDPRDVTGQTQLDALSAFMKFLAEKTGRVAILTHENAKDAVILRVSADARPA